MMEKETYRVLMIGPDRSVHGGISGVVNNYYDAGLDRIVDLRYIGTMVEGSKVLKLFQAVKAYVRFLAALPHYDIVHVNMASDVSYYRKAVFICTAGICGKKIVIHQHGGDFTEFYEKELSDRGRDRVRRVLSMGDAFLVLGNAWKDFFGALIGRDRITVLPDAIPIPEPKEKTYGAHKILYLGRLCEAKGIGELLTVMPGLHERYPDAHLYLGGIWEDAGLKKRAAALGGYVTDLGWISGDEKQRYLQECDIFVMPSHFEGQSLSVLEAMANACAIAASETGGIPDMIADGETGLLTVPQDVSSLAGVLSRLLADPELCRVLGENARIRARKDYSIDNNIRRLLAIYASVSRRESQHEER